MAKKRYHEGHMKMGEEDGGAIVSSGHYAGKEDRRRTEMHDAGMISEDHGAIANLPQNVMMKPYPKGGDYIPEDLDDTIRGIDAQMHLDNSQRRRNFVPKKV